MADLLESQRQLLCDLVDAVREAEGTNPLVRATTGGRSGARVFVRGELDGRRPHADLDELRAQGFLRQVKTEKGNVFYAMTPAAHAARDKLAARARRPAAKARPTSLAPEFATALTTRERLDEMLVTTSRALDGLLDVSAVEDRFEPGSGVVTADPWRWAPLEAKHRLLLGEARQRLDQWLAAARRVIATNGPEHLPAFDAASEELRTVVVRSTSSPGPHARSAAAARQGVHEALKRQVNLLEELPAAHRPRTTLVLPDTNALIADPDLERWVIPEPSTIVIPAQVVSELDGKKMDHTIGPKATSLIRRFKEYGHRRGDPETGVPLVGQRRFGEVAFHPDMSRMPELDQDHADDRILATAVEIATRELNSVVIVVTRDRNMHNKARQLNLPAVDVADL